MSEGVEAGIGVGVGVGVLEAVYLPPYDDQHLSEESANALVHFERYLLQPEGYRVRHPEDVRLGLVTLEIEEEPRPGAQQFLERLALSDRVRVWISSPRFVEWGRDYANEIRAWLGRIGVQPRILNRLGYTNLLLPNSVPIDPAALSTPVNQFLESDIWDRLLQLQGADTWTDGIEG